MKVIFYVLDLVKTVLRHICMLCEHFKKHDSAPIHKREENQQDNTSAVKDNNTEKGDIV